MFGKERLREFAEARFTEAHSHEGRGEGRHGHHEERHHGRHGGFGAGFEGFLGRGRERGFGGGFGSDRERLFDSGELRLVILQLVAEKPSYGYEIIKAIEERLSGGYAPSPGVVYPTLTLLEEEGYAISSMEGTKKLFTITESGTEYLKTNQATLKAIFGRMEQAGQAFGRGRSPQIMRAIMNLKFALKIRASQGTLSPEQTRRIAEAIDAAARVIGEV
ncbi:PadR family transcriptional regulator [Acidicapsa ligni]|uniref:PadR family transcriptional regulator n=1 Tax=Acidicapsa ligni TaxID=542300 RepID=UPI0021DF7C53|nr:PadR family transcriptional regulator [Acidicapsa ligni]